MKRLSQLWDRLISWDNLLLAYHKARRGKRSRPDVAQFALALEPALLKLQQQLRNGTYRPGSWNNKPAHV
ncbi:MAG: RNA-dependent DNA polymerase, partial [Haliscomenobacter sp.]